MSGTNIPMIPQQVNLHNVINTEQCYCLNAAQTQTLNTILAGGDALLESDCDQQLLICIRFNQSCMLHAIRISGPQDGIIEFYS